MLAQQDVKIKLEQGEARIDVNYGLSIDQGPYSRVGLELVEAIRLAKEVLAYAQDYMADIADDSLCQDEYEALAEAMGGDPATLAALERLELAQEARWDATSAHWGHD